MRKIWAVVTAGLAVSLAATAQDEAPKPKVSKEPLYRVSQWLGIQPLDDRRELVL